MTLEPDSILFTEGGDNQVFTLLYHHLVEHMRPDVTVWDQKGNVFEGLYGDLMRITSQQLNENTITGDYSQWATGRPIYYTWKDYSRVNEINQRYFANKGYPNRTFETVGILYRIVPENFLYRPLIDHWQYYKFPWRTYPGEAIHWDYLTREIIANYNFQLGEANLTKAEEFLNAWYAKPRPASYGGIPADRFQAKAKEYEDRGFGYYEDAGKFGYDMTAIHFNFAIFLEQRAIQYFRENNRAKAMELYAWSLKKYAAAADTDAHEMRVFLTWAQALERLASIDTERETAWLSDARKVLARALKNSPKDGQILQALGVVDGLIAYPSRKLLEMQDKLNAHPTVRSNVQVLLTALLSRGEKQIALQLLNNVYRYYPGDWDFLTQLVQISMDLQDSPKAVFYLEKMSAIQPDNPYILLTLAELYLTKIGDVRKAAEDYNRVIRAAGTDPRFSKEVGQAQQRLMQIQK